MESSLQGTARPCRNPLPIARRYGAGRSTPCPQKAPRRPLNGDCRAGSSPGLVHRSPAPSRVSPVASHAPNGARRACSPYSGGTAPAFPASLLSPAAALAPVRTPAPPLFNWLYSFLYYTEICMLSIFYFFFLKFLLPLYGFEKEKEYYDIAMRRIEDARMQTRLAL